MKPENNNSSAQASTAGTSSTANVGYVHWDGEDQEEADVWSQFPGATFVGSAMVDIHAAGLVSSPGFGVVDSGCGKTLVGIETLLQLERMIDASGYGPVRYAKEENTFRFGNGAIEKTDKIVHLPLGLGGRQGVIKAAVIQGAAPLLLGRPTLETLDVKLNFKDRVMNS